MRRFSVRAAAVVVYSFFLVLPLAVGAGQRSEAALSFGVVPQQSASKLAQTWLPVLSYLERVSGVEIRFRTAPDIPEFERRVAAGEYDIAYMNPYHYTVFSKAPGYRAFAKSAGQRLKGILVVQKESPVRAPEELRGATIAFPAPAAFAATILTRAFLAGEGVAHTPKYVSSHDSVYLSVAKGLYPAGGGVVRTFDSLEPAVRDRLRILWETEGVTPHAFAAHPRVPEETVRRLIDAMQSMGTTEEGRRLLEPLAMQGFEQAGDADWDDVRALGIDLLDKPVEDAP